MTSFIDTHAHLYYDRFDPDRTEMMVRTWQNCEAVVCIGAGIESSLKSIDEASKDPRVFASVGIHPHETQDDPNRLRELAQNPKVVAIGECGLDYKIDPVHPHSVVDKKSQQDQMQTQIKLANELNLPVIIHARNCWEDLLPLLKNAPPKSGVIHSWTGGLKDAQGIFELGLHISFSGMLTYPANDHIRQVAALAPIDRIVIETDAPYLPPQAVRGQRNEPAFVKLTAEKLAEVRGVEVEAVGQATTNNAKKLFRLNL